MTHAGPDPEAGGTGAEMDFAGIDRPSRVALPADPELLHAMAQAMPGWPRGPAAGPVATADVTVLRDGDAWRVVATGWPGGESPAADPLSAANALAGLLVDAQLYRSNRLLGLHAAVAVFGAGAVVTLGHTGAGKSTLVLRLAARGLRALGDDRVLLDTGDVAGADAVALGLAPKARLPLPSGDADLAAFIERRGALWVGDAVWLDGKAMAPFGTRAPLAAFVVLDRRADAGKARLEPLGAGPLAAQLIEQATAPADGAVALVARIARLAAGGGHRLVYADGVAACDVLAAQFGAIR